MVEHKQSFKEKQVEPDNLSMSFLYRWFFVLSVVFIAICIFVVYFFRWEVRRLIFKKELSVPSSSLEEIISRDQKRLTTYDVINEEKGIYQIPIDAAIEYLANNPDLIGPIKP